MDDNATRGTGILAVIVWALAAAATAALLAGNRAAIVGVVGTVILALLTTASWWGYRRQDQALERARPHRMPRRHVDLRGHAYAPHRLQQR
jgi:uncharacterized membrane protein